MGTHAGEDSVPAGVRRRQLQWYSLWPKEPPYGSMSGTLSAVSAYGFAKKKFEAEHTFVLERVEIGWPIYTMTSRGLEDTRPSPGTWFGRVIAQGIPAPGYPALGLGADRRLPLQPIWTPFLLTVLATAMALELFWQAVRTPGRVRRHQRRKGGRCLQCGYELNGLAGCPECGESLTPRAATGRTASAGSSP